MLGTATGKIEDLLRAGWAAAKVTTLQTIIGMHVGTLEVAIAARDYVVVVKSTRMMCAR